MNYNGKIVTALDLYGKSTQTTYEGKNLISYPYYNADGTICGITWATEDDGYITGSGTTTSGCNFNLVYAVCLEPSTTYTISYIGTVSGMIIRVYNNATKTAYATLTSSTSSYTFTTSDTETDTYRIYFNIGSSGAEVDIGCYVQLEKGSSATDYEQYVGGIASPNPSYPQDIVSVENPVVTLMGKNVIPYPYYTDDGTLTGVTWATEEDGYITGSGTTTGGTNFHLSYYTILEPSTTYTISYIGTVSGMILRVYNNATSTIYATLTSSTSSYTFTTSDTDTDTYRIYFNIGSSGAEVDIGCYVQLEEGSSTTSYEPYNYQEFSLDGTLRAIPCTSGGNYTDTDGQMWYADEWDCLGGTITRYCTSLILDGDESYSLRGTTSTDGSSMYSISVTDNSYLNGTYTYSALCSHFTDYGTTVASYATALSSLSNGQWVRYYYSNSGSSRVIYFATSTCTTVSELQTWLASNNVEFVYPADDVTEEEV